MNEAVTGPRKFSQDVELSNIDKYADLLRIITFVHIAIETQG